MSFNKIGRPNRGFTLLELIATITVIGVLSGLAVPMYGRAIESARGHQAVAGLRQIHTAERIYRSEDGFYFPHQPTHPGAADATEMYDDLNLFLDEADWTYSVDTTGLDDFTATATRSGGGAAYNGAQIQIDENGVPAPGAPAWPLALPQE